ncbi:LysR family transcriptional regulator [Klebsiella aerogenes]
MSKLDLNALRVFVNVVENGSFSGAARALRMPSSNVSRQISQLEEKLQLRLIQRSTRHMHLTDAGQAFFNNMRPLLDQLAATEAALTQQQGDPEGLLRLCLPNEIGPTLFGPMLAQFAMRYPKIEVSCVVSLAGADALKEDIDIAVAIVRGKMEDASYIARPLATFPCCVVAAPSLLEKCGQPVRCEQLASLPCITTVSALKGQAWQFITARNAFKKVNVQAHFRVNSGEIALHAAVAGVGFAILAEQACRPFIASGQLKVIELELPPAPLHLVALYRERHFLPARSRVWLDFMQQHLAAN